MQYADLYRGRKVRNTHTYEFGEITGAANALVEITLTSGPDAGEEITMPPQEAMENWVGIN